MEEFLFQALFEVLFQLLAGWLGDDWKPPGGWWMACLCLLGGLVAGALSLWPFPTLLLASDAARAANIVLVPIAIGGAVAAFGAWRRSRGKPPLLLGQFVHAYLFALGVALVRLIGGQ